MIRLVCNCGRRLRARDEAALRNAVCPSCGCPVGLSSTLNSSATPRPKPLTLSERELPGKGFAVVPLWKEGLASAKVLPRYQVVTDDDANDEGNAATRGPEQAAAERDRVQRRRRGGPLQIDWNKSLLFPFRCWQSITALTLLLGAAVGAGLLIVVNSRLEPVPLKVALSLAPPFAGLVMSISFWMLVFTSTARGADSFAFWHSSIVREFFIHFLRCLASFCTGPLWILALAGYFWFYSGDLKLVDKVILAELVLAAFLHWWLMLLAVTVEDSLRSITPNGISAALRRLGIKTALIATGVVVLAILLIGSSAGRTIISGPHDGRMLILIAICSVALQVFLALLARRLGIAYFLAASRRSVEAGA